MVANNQSIIYNIETGEERILPDIPNGVRVTNPLDGSAILLPLSPPEGCLGHSPKNSSQSAQLFGITCVVQVSALIRADLQTGNRPCYKAMRWPLWAPSRVRKKMRGAGNSASS